MALVNRDRTRLTASRRRARLQNALLVADREDAHACGLRLNELC